MGEYVFRWTEGNNKCMSDLLDSTCYYKPINKKIIIEKEVKGLIESAFEKWSSYIEKVALFNKNLSSSSRMLYASYSAWVISFLKIGFGFFFNKLH